MGISEIKTVAVTGASGYIALHIIQQLLSKGYQVRGTLRDLTRTDSIAAALQKSVDIAGLTFARADLTSDEGWEEAFEDCDFLIHSASPVPLGNPENEEELIATARGGTLRALNAAKANGIKRVVLTSSVAAIYSGRKEDRPFTEEDWSDLESSASAYPAYAKSKTYAEKAAWEFAESEGVELSVINPSLVIGPLLDPDGSASLEAMRWIVGGKLPGWPRMGFTFVDVRDVAAAHIMAMTDPAAVGRRYICANEFLWFAEVAQILKPYLAGRERKISARQLPDWMVKAASFFDSSLRIAVNGLGLRNELDSSRLRRELGWRPRDIGQTLYETADSMIDHKLV